MSEKFNMVAEALGVTIAERFILSRGGHPLLALPRAGDAALRTLDLYQPQRGLGKRVAALLRKGSRFGLHRILLKPDYLQQRHASGKRLLPGNAADESIGILFGSSEHRVFRAVLSYRNGTAWEVAKLACGAEGTAMLQHEAGAMRSIGATVSQVPEVLGIESNGYGCLLRMPYLSGTSLVPGDTAPVRLLLESWLSDDPPEALSTFPEWSAVESAIKSLRDYDSTVDRLAELTARKSIRHGDFARWNMLRTDNGQLKVLDWEWGEREGLSGLDLVHYLAQDFRLVQRLSSGEAIAQTIAQLKSPTWSPFMERSGWAGHELDLILVCLAFKQGAEHQDNQKILRACLSGNIT